MLTITEIFRSIQGEGTRAGEPCIFVRLTGCNLRCTWCDTAYAFYGGTRMPVNEVLGRVEALSVTQALLTAHSEKRQGTASPQASGARATDTNARVARAISLVEITGGEPLLQPESVSLAEQLLARGYTVLVETSGERPIASLPREVIKIVDVKCPDSGEADTFDPANLAAVGAEDEFKFVIATRRDYEFARDFTRQNKLHERVRAVLFSPVMAGPEGKWPEMDRRALAEWILADGLPVRLGLQLHKFIWDPAMKGV
jgi:7-carboxy-7-deazaguanine synthase